MEGKITVEATQEKRTKSDKPYLVVKSSTGKFYPIWQENQYLWPLFEIGKTLQVMITDKGNIVEVVGEKPKDNWGDQFTSLAERVTKLENKIEDMVAKQIPPL